MSYVNHDVDRWLKASGIEFNPFLHLEASGDRNLLKFLLLHEDLGSVWEDVSALIVAQRGGGKTALRHYATWASWRGIYAFFPVPYILPSHWDRRPPADFVAQLAELNSAFARSLLFYCLVLPQRYLELVPPLRQELCTLLWRCYREMPLLASRYRHSRQNGVGKEIWHRMINDLAEPAQTGAFAKPPERHLQLVLRELLVDSESKLVTDELSLFKQFIEFSRDIFNFRAIHFLVDGIDAFPKNSLTDELDSQKEKHWLYLWLSSLESIHQYPVRIKVFSPPAMLPTEKQLAKIEGMNIRLAEFVWNPRLLSEVIRKRLYVATNEHFDSLDAISDSGILNLDMLLAQRVRPLPREIVAITRRILIEHVRTHPNDPLLRGADIDAAFEWYEADTAHRPERPRRALPEWARRR